MSRLKDENFLAEIYIEPNDGELTDEHSGNKDGRGLFDNLCGNQLNACAELALSGDQIDETGFVKSVSSLKIEQANKIDTKGSADTELLQNP